MRLLCIAPIGVTNFVCMKAAVRLNHWMLILFTGWVASASSQLEVAMECVQVNAAGNATVSWTQPADPSGLFYQYVFHQFPASNPANISTTNMPDYASNSVIAPGVNGNDAAVCYFVVTQSTDGSSAISDTVCNTFLLAQPSFTPGFADLSWNSPYIATESIGGDFTVQKSDNNGGWIDLGLVPDNGGMHSFAYEVEECSEVLEFRVIQEFGAMGCQHESNRSGSEINDELDPTAPAITDIDVDSLSGLAVLHWEPSPAADLAGYIIYLCSGGFQVPIDTLFDPYATTYTNQLSNAIASIESYNVAAFDSCFVNGAPDPGAANPGCSTTLHINASRQPCSDVAVIAWAGPYGLDGDVVGFDIYAQQAIDAGTGSWGASQLIGSANSGANEFIHEGAVLGSIYRYWVEANHSTGAVSLSNLQTLDFLYPGAPSYTQILRASALDSSGVEIVVDFDASMTEQHNFILERRKAEDSPANYIRLDAITAVGGMDVQFEDLGAHSQVMSYTYRIRVENLCNDSVMVSNEATTMLLDGNADEEQLVNTLSWNEYAEFPGSVSAYRIYRSENGGSPQALITLPPSVTTFEDELDQITTSTGEFCYIIEAIDSEPTTSGGINYALSNSLCLSLPPVIWVPNAFTVGGFNPIFKPVISFADLTTFRMEVFSRWGDVIFSTNDIQYGWDGTVGGAVVQEGAYGYTMWVQNGAGRQFMRSGLVNVLVDL